MKKMIAVLTVAVLIAAGIVIGGKLNYEDHSKSKKNVTILQADYPEYNTAPELVDASDLVFQGTVRNIEYQMLDVSTEKGRDQDTGL